MGTKLEFAKTSLAHSISFWAEMFPSRTYLATGPVEDIGRTDALIKNFFNKLEPQKKNKVYGKVWELAKLEDPCIHGERWGETHVFDNIERLVKAMHRLGLLEKNNLAPVDCLPYFFGEGGLGAQYFALGEKKGREPATGQIGLINGMGIPTLEHAGRDAAGFSDKFAEGNNIHCVYNPTHQKSPTGDMVGFCFDVMRMMAINGVSYAKTSYLAAQQIIDFLDANPDKKYLQVGVSEGAAHVHATIRLVQHVRPDLLPRIRILTLCPAYFILPQEYGNKIQVLNFIKTEDKAVLPWAKNADKIGHSKNIVIVPHNSGDNPHNHLSDDFKRVVKPYIDAFLQSGNLLSIVI